MSGEPNPDQQVISPGVAAALLQMATSVTEQRARTWAEAALARGADGHTMRAAWRAWQAERDAEVQRVGTGRCLCSHHVSHHEDGRECRSAACGCRRFQEDTR